MNQVFLSGIALVIAFVLWSSKKQSKGSAFFKFDKDPLKNIDTTTSFVQKKNLNNPTKPKNIKNLNSKRFSTQLSINSIEIKKKLTKLFSSKPSDRLLAIKLACQWENKKALPFLRRGLRDSDSRVVIASAAGISSYKGKTIDLNKKSQVSRPPRNVSLMR
tara:strand:- start:150 stop:632 length:483 start_codon:yes stop_codon:yes gene_type:complete